MRASARRTPSKIEYAECLTRGPLDERPVQQHVRVHAVILLQGRHPGHLELSGPLKPTAAGYGAPLIVRTPEPDVVGKPLCQGFEEEPGQRRRTEVAHVP